MHWTDEGVILATRRHGETSLIVELMTSAHGRHLGLVRGGRSPRHHAILQPGNSVSATWRARLDEPLTAGALLVRFEAGILEELGFGLDLERCAATGTTGELAYVSPKTGRAVSRTAGQPYNDRLLSLPAFMVANGAAAEPGVADIMAGFRLTGYFLARHVYEPRGIEPPDARSSFLALVGRTACAA